MESEPVLSGHVCIIISNWNGWRDTVACLESVFQSSYPDYQVVVRDNFSSDGSQEKILAWAREKSIACVSYDRKSAEAGGTAGERAALVFIQTGENLGYAGGNNVALRYAMGKGAAEYVWLLNNDTIVSTDALSELVKLADSDARIGMVSSKLLYFDKPDTIQAAGGARIVPWMGNASIIGVGEKDAGQWDSQLEPDFLNGASVLVKTKTIAVIGLMAERYFLYWEDADWGVRARRAGYRIVYCPTSRVLHKEGGTMGSINPRTDYYIVRNGLYFTKTFYPIFLPLVPFAYLAKYTLIRALKRQPLNFMAYVKGLFDFLRGKTGAM